MDLCSNYPGTDTENLTQENYVFTFIRKSTNDSVLVRVRPEIFPTGYFDLRKKVEHGIPREATEEERERYEKWEREVRDAELRTGHVEKLRASSNPLVLQLIGFERCR